MDVMNLSQARCSFTGCWPKRNALKFDIVLNYSIATPWNPSPGVACLVPQSVLGNALSSMSYRINMKRN